MSPDLAQYEIYPTGHASLSALWRYRNQPREVDLQQVQPEYLRHKRFLVLHLFLGIKQTNWKTS